MKNKIIGSAILSFLIVAQICNADSQLVSIPSLAPIPSDNSMNKEKIELGKMLFFDPRLSGSNWISCATCHNPALAFTDRIERSLGHNMSEGPRNTPTILNIAFLELQFWDGRAKTLEDQALGPIEAEKEMNEKLDNAVNKLKEIPAYTELFKKAFNEEDPVNKKNIAKALAAFERTQITTNSPLDRYLNGDENAISEQAKKGMDLFKNAGCINCHNGPALSDSSFHVIKVPGSTDLGRYLVTKKEEDKHAFRTPTLRNVELTWPYMNNGSVPSLNMATKIMLREAVGKELSEEEIKNIEAFLKTLTGEVAKFEYPLLP